MRCNHVHSTALSTVPCRNMLVQWTTKDAGTPTVKYGTTATSLTMNTTGNTSTYTRYRCRERRASNILCPCTACCFKRFCPGGGLGKSTCCMMQQRIVINGASTDGCCGLQGNDVSAAGQHLRLDRAWCAHCSHRAISLH